MMMMMNTKEPQGLYVVLTGKGPMDLLWFRGRAVDLLFGTSQLSVPWQTLMLPRLSEKLDQ